MLYETLSLQSLDSGCEQTYLRIKYFKDFLEVVRFSSVNIYINFKLRDFNLERINLHYTQCELPRKWRLTE